MKTITITPDLPYFSATVDCCWATARRIARDLGLGPDHLAAIDAAEAMADEEAGVNDAG